VRKLKKISRVFLMILVAVVVVGNLEATPVLAAKKVTLIWTRWEQLVRKAYGEEIARLFEKEHPGIKVKLQFPANYNEKVLVSIAGGTPPDVMDFDAGGIGMFLKRRALVDLSPYIERDNLTFPEDTFFPVFDYYKYKGKMYGLPCIFAPSGIFYNKDLFDKAGVPYPTDDWTWKDHLRIARKMTKVNEETGRTEIWGCLAVSVHSQIPLICNFGGRIMNEDHTRCVVDSPEGIKGIQLYRDYVLKYKVAPSPTEAQRFGGGWTAMFAAGKMATMWAHPWMISYFKKAGVNFDIVRVFTNATGEKVAYIDSDGIGIPVGSKHIEEAWEFIKFRALSYEAQKLGQLAHDSISIRKDVAYKFFPDPNTPLREEVWLEAQKDGYYYPFCSEYGQEENYIWNQEMEAMTLGKKTAEETAKAIASRINALRKRK